MDTASQISTLLSWLPQYTQFSSILSSLSDENFIYAIIPISICVVGVHLMFKHFFSLIWFSMKFCLALVLYIQIRGVVVTFIEKDPLSIEYRLFGIPSGTLEYTKSIGIGIIKARVFSTLMAARPNWFLFLGNIIRPVEDISPENEKFRGEKEEHTDESWSGFIRGKFMN